MRRRIVGFERDDNNDWVARLACHHRQHVRHQPPFRNAPWIHDRAARNERIGTKIDCPLCDRAELPPHLIIVHTTEIWDEHTLPERLRQSHRIAPGTWGRLRVLSGQLRFNADTDPPLDRMIHSGETQSIPPSVDHTARPDGPMRACVEFLRPAATSDRQQGSP